MYRQRSHLLSFVAGALALATISPSLSAWRAAAAPGDADSTFVPISPCRLSDTRPGEDGIGAVGSASRCEMEARRPSELEAPTGSVFFPTKRSVSR